MSAAKATTTGPAMTQNWNRPDILMIGAAARNVGKTEFACRLIQQSTGHRPVIGLKVTTVRERDGRCPRGGEGCGACSSLTEPFCITRETDSTGGKDTNRMLRAGADAVFWLRVFHENLKAGLAAVLKEIPPNAVVVMESNSARELLQPGLFLVVQEQGQETIKPTCATVLEHADRVFTFDGQDWSFQPDECIFSDGRWGIRESAAGIVLAGGKSRRMGTDKSLLELHGRPLIEHIVQQLQPNVSQLIIGANDPDKFTFLGHEVVTDEQPDCGPLMGILSCLTRCKSEHALVVGCDIPDLNLPFFRRLLREAVDVDVVMPRTSAGHLEPLFAVYSKSAIDPARAILERGGRRIIDLVDVAKIKYVTFPETGWYHNLNTPNDVDQYRKGIGL